MTTEDRKDSHRGGQRIVFEGHERKSDEVGRSLDARIKDNQSERRQRDSDRRGRDSSPMRRSRRPERRLDDGRSATYLSIFSCSLSCFTIVSSLGGRSPEYPFHCRDDLPVRGMYSDRGSRQDRERDRDRDRGGYGDRRGSGRDRYERQSSPGKSCWPALHTASGIAARESVLASSVCSTLSLCEPKSASESHPRHHWCLRCRWEVCREIWQRRKR